MGSGQRPGLLKTSTAGQRDGMAGVTPANHCFLKHEFNGCGATCVAESSGTTLRWQLDWHEAQNPSGTLPVEEVWERWQQDGDCWCRRSAIPQKLRKHEERLQQHDELRELPLPGVKPPTTSRHAQSRLGTPLNTASSDCTPIQSENSRLCEANMRETPARPVTPQSLCQTAVESEESSWPLGIVTLYGLLFA